MWHHWICIDDLDDVFLGNLVAVRRVVGNELGCELVHEALLSLSEIVLRAFCPPLRDVRRPLSKDQFDHLLDCILLVLVEVVDAWRRAQPVVWQHKLSQSINLLFLSDEDCAQGHAFDVGKVAPLLGSLDALIDLDKFHTLLVNLVLEVLVRDGTD